MANTKQDKNLSTNEAEIEAEKNFDDMTDTGKEPFKLRKPVLNNGEELKELTFDFEKLTGADSLEIQAELDAIGKTAAVPAYSSEYLVRMAIRACEQDVDIGFFKRLSIVDFNKIMMRMRFFLIASSTQSS